MSQVIIHHPPFPTPYNPASWSDAPELTKIRANRGKEAVDKALSRFDTAVDKLYPTRANPPRLPTLQLHEYAGVYSHPAYHNLTLELAEPPSDAQGASTTVKTGKLKGSREDEVWQFTYDFAHVSGEFWVILLDMKNSPNQLNGQVAKAEFRIGPSGRVEQLVVEYTEDQSEGIITYAKIA